MEGERPQIVILDGRTLNPGDLSWQALESLGEVSVHDYTPPGAIIERAAMADILLVNKTILDGTVLAKLPRLRCICVTASGYNNIDLEAAARQNIFVCNAVGYGTASVAQHVFALLLALTNRVQAHHDSVMQGRWGTGVDFCYTLAPIPELAGKTMGIYGFGRIGQQVAHLAQAFGMTILATHKHPERDARPGVRFVPLEELFAASDVISLHAPLGPDNHRIVNAKLLASMKPTAYLLNTGRGGLIDEAALRAALEAGQLAGAGLDVLATEPPREGSILFGAPNCLITPHLAWATREARQRLLDIAIENVRAFLEGKPVNVVRGGKFQG
jgi:glycerate dehydrogenase